MARKGLPDAIKIANGTFRPDRAAPTNVPSIPLKDRPAPPECLQDAGQKAWHDLCDFLEPLSLLEQRFLHAMEMYCRAWDRMAKYETQLQNEPEFFMAESGYVCAHPAVGLAQKARDDIRRYQIEFGFTPSSARTVVAAVKTAKTQSVPSRKRDLA